jgi:Flp pilus assembly protein TadB
MKLTILSWLAGLLGFGLLVVGVSMISLPAAFVVAGTGLMAWAWLADRASAAMQRKAQGG